MDARKLGHPLPITSHEGGKEKQGHKILAASFTSQKPSRVKVQFMIQKIPDNGKYCTVLWKHFTAYVMLLQIYV
jgi:hypothetical protein